MKTPPISRDAFECLVRAVSYLSADDLLDDSDEDERQLDAAEAWIRRVWAMNQERKDSQEHAR